MQSLDSAVCVPSKMGETISFKGLLSSGIDVHLCEYLTKIGLIFVNLQQDYSKTVCPLQLTGLVPLGKITSVPIPSDSCLLELNSTRNLLMPLFHASLWNNKYWRIASAWAVRDHDIRKHMTTYISSFFFYLFLIFLSVWGVMHIILEDGFP